MYESKQNKVCVTVGFILEMILACNVGNQPCFWSLNGLCLVISRREAIANYTLKTYLKQALGLQITTIQHLFLIHYVCPSNTISYQIQAASKITVLYSIIQLLAILCNL